MDQATTFGVEIEGFGFRCHRDEDFFQYIADIVSESGYSAHTYWDASRNGGKHFQTWEVKSEGVGDSRYIGFEITTPILKGDSGMKQFKTVYDHLVKSGMKVNNSCGMHVHIGVPENYTINNMASLIKRYRDHENEIDSVIIQNRRENNNGYCESMKYFSDDVLLRIMSNSHSLSDFCARFDRLKLAVNQYVEHGTVEFRHHGGTLDSTVAEMWVKFCINFMLTTKLISDGEMEDKGAFTGMNEEEIVFFMQRKDYLNEKASNL